MKKKYFLPIILFTILAAGCTKDFLNRTPLDSFDDSNFWTNETNIRLHSMYYYASYFRGYGNSGGSGWDAVSYTHLGFLRVQPQGQQQKQKECVFHRFIAL